MPNIIINVTGYPTGALFDFSIEFLTQTQQK